MFRYSEFTHDRIALTNKKQYTCIIDTIGLRHDRIGQDRKKNAAGTIS